MSAEPEDRMPLSPLGRASAFKSRRACSFCSVQEALACKGWGMIAPDRAEACWHPILMGKKCGREAGEGIMSYEVFTVEKIQCVIKCGNGQQRRARKIKILERAIKIHLLRYFWMYVLHGTFFWAAGEKLPTQNYCKLINVSYTDMQTKRGH